MANDATTTRSYFHVQRARPVGIVFSVIGIAGLCATWLISSDFWVPDWFSKILMTVIFGACLVLGASTTVAGGYYRTWFAEGRVHWEYPGWFYGKSDSCPLENVVEFQQIVVIEGSTIYRFILKDGRQKSIPQDCFGDFIAFDQALWQEKASPRKTA